MSNRNSFIFLSILFLPILPISAKVRVSDPRPFPYIVTSKPSMMGQCYFKMIPGAEGKGDLGRGTGVAYQVKSGQDLVLWKTEGWYGYEVFLSADGKYLARLGNTMSGQQDPDPDLVVAFYDSGRLLRKYVIKDLLDIKIAGHAPHEARRQLLKVKGFDEASGFFSICIGNSLEYLFDPKNGHIVKIMTPYILHGPARSREIAKINLPDFPSWAKSHALEASVRLGFEINPDGTLNNIIRVKRTSGYPELDLVAKEALKKWGFKPEPDSPNHGEITFNFFYAEYGLPNKSLSQTLPSRPPEAKPGNAR